VVGYYTEQADGERKCVSVTKPCKNRCASSGHGGLSREFCGRVGYSICSEEVKWERNVS